MKSRNISTIIILNRFMIRAFYDPPPAVQQLQCSQASQRNNLANAGRSASAIEPLSAPGSSPPHQTIRGARVIGVVPGAGPPHRSGAS